MKDFADNSTIDAWQDEKPQFRFLVYKFCHNKKLNQYVLNVYEAHAHGGLQASKLVGDNFDNGGFEWPLTQCDAYFTHFKYRENPQTKEKNKAEFISRHVIDQRTYKTWQDIRAISAKFGD